MTAKEKLLSMEKPELIEKIITGWCPSNFGMEDNCRCVNDAYDCESCWNREIPEEPQEQPCTIGAGAPPKCTDTPTQPQILDSGNRREFETGAVRDIQEGKGRCDLLPLDVVAWLLGVENADSVLMCIHNFVIGNATSYLYDAVELGRNIIGVDINTMILDLAKHFESGAKKYGERNWQKGIPVRCYIDSAVRHYLKFLRGDQDEPHDRAFMWNIVCAIWTCEHKPELNEYAREDKA
jgi:hypothetical protein